MVAGRFVRYLKIWSGILGCFSNLAGLDTAGADLLSMSTALRKGHADRLQVWIEPAPGAVIGVRDIVTELG